MFPFPTGSVTPGPGGYTYPVKSPIIWNISPRISRETCTVAEAQEFLSLVLNQGDIIPPGQAVEIRQQEPSEINIDNYLLIIGQLPLVLSFAGPPPSKVAADIPYPTSHIQTSPQYPYFYEWNIGEAFFTAPQIPGASNNLGPQAFRTDFKLQIKADGSFAWVGLDQPTWQGIVAP